MIFPTSMSGAKTWQMEPLRELGVTVDPDDSCSRSYIYHTVDGRCYVQGGETDLSALENYHVVFSADRDAYPENDEAAWEVAKMLTTIQSDGDGFYVLVPEKILSELGLGVGQALEVSVVNNTIILAPTERVRADFYLGSLTIALHKEVLGFFEGDTVAKDRWMASRVYGLGGRCPNQMLQSESDIEAVRLLIGRLEHGSLP